MTGRRRRGNIPPLSYSSRPPPVGCVRPNTRHLYYRASGANPAAACGLAPASRVACVCRCVCVRVVRCEAAGVLSMFLVPGAVPKFRRHAVGMREHPYGRVSL